MLTTKFCVPAIILALGSAGVARADWCTTDWVSVCLPVDAAGYVECNPDPPFSLAVIQKLEGSSKWLMGLGFKPPLLMRDPQDLESAAKKLETVADGQCSPLPWIRWVRGDIACIWKGKKLAACYQVEQRINSEWAPAQLKNPVTGELYLNPGLGLHTIRITTLARDFPEVNHSAPTHELFHAIQASYGLDTSLSPWLWFMEGTAATVEAVHAGDEYLR